MIKLFSDAEYDSAKSRQKLPLKCLECESTFHRTKHQIQQSIRGNIKAKYDYCSPRCGNHARFSIQQVTCTQCGKTFQRKPSSIGERNYCSNSCNAIWTNAHKKHGTRRSKLEVWLEEQLPTLFPDLEFHFNRKDAINSELDIYIPSLKLAFELNGIFHYEPIYGPEKLASIQNNDERKSQACHEAGIEFCIIDTSSQKYFKPKSSQRFLDIIYSVIISKNTSNS